MLTIRSSLISSIAAGLLSLLFLQPLSALAAERGLAWGVNDAWAPTIADKPLIKWAHHWQLGPIKTLPDKVEYVPTNWGPKYSSDWAKRVVEMNCSLPTYILAYNEPDVVSQSNMTPIEAALAYITELEPYRQMGVQVSSPQIAWNYTWLDTFLTELRSRGSDVDFIAVHYYGSYKSLSTAQSYISQAWSKYKLPVWVTEIGTTNASKGTNAQVRQFMIEFIKWLDLKAYVKRVAWTGCYALDSPPDNYISKYTSMFFADGKLRRIGKEYACGSSTC